MGEAMMLRISQVEYLNDYKLQVTFNNGKIKNVDLENLVQTGGFYFEPLKNKNAFKSVAVDDMNYSICWPNGADLSPDTLYEMGIEMKKAARKQPLRRQTKRHVPLSSKSRASLLKS